MAKTAKTFEQLIAAAHENTRHNDQRPRYLELMREAAKVDCVRVIDVLMEDIEIFKEDDSHRMFGPAAAASLANRTVEAIQQGNIIDIEKARRALELAVITLTIPGRIDKGWSAAKTAAQEALKKLPKLEA